MTAYPSRFGDHAMGAQELDQFGRGDSALTGCPVAITQERSCPQKLLDNLTHN
jgi:hypothetical protein